MNRITLRITCILLFCIASCKCYAQSADDQILIFRNNGETNLLWQSKLDSIITTNIDTLGNIYDEPVAQIFHYGDESLYVSIAEIDSVCFGSRNQIEIRQEVRLLTDAKDISWIIGYDGEYIYYRKDTPADVLPKTGDKLYYADVTELFPCGLCAKVTGVNHREQNIAVAVTGIENTEIFSKFFFAGTSEDLQMARKYIAKVEEVDRAEPVIFTLPLGNNGEMSVDGSLRIRSENIVIDVFQHYYHAKFRVETSIGLGFKASSRESTSGSLEKTFASVKLPTVAGVFVPRLSIGGFLDYNAELSVQYNMVRKNTTNILWTRKNGQQSFEMNSAPEPKAQENQAKIDLILNGSVFGGIVFGVDFSLIGDIVGARAKVKYGGELSGTLSMGMLNDLSKSYETSAYGFAKLSLKNLLRFEGYTVRRSGWIWGDVEENKFVEYTPAPLWQRTIDLFPEYCSTRASMPTPKRKEISVTAKVKKPIAHALETGYQILDKQEEAIDSVFVGNIEANKENIQAIKEAVVPVNSTELDSLKVRPVFHYAGYTIPYDAVGVSQDPNIQPIIFYGSNVIVSYVSGVPIVGNKKVDDNVYHIGPFLPVAVYDKDYHETSPYLHAYCEYIEPIGMCGRWNCENDDFQITIVLKDDGTGSIQENGATPETIRYEVNVPQSGRIKLRYDDYSKPPVLFDIISLKEDEMEVKFCNTYPQYKSYIFEKILD